MNAAALLAEVQRLGVTLEPHGNRLHVDAPRGVLTEKIIEELRESKGELLALLNSEQQCCAQCLAREAQGIKVLACSCGYFAELEMLRPSAEDLRYSLAYVQDQVRTLHQPYLGMWRYWVDLYESEGWGREEAERGAFRRVLRWKGYREVSPSG